MALVFLLSLPQVYSACTGQTGGRVFDFSSVDSQFLGFNDSIYNMSFTFCRPGPDLCDGEQASICQMALNHAWEASLGLWSAAKWSATDRGLVAVFTGKECHETGSPRLTTIRFECRNEDGKANFTNWNETSTCVYDGVIQVPRAVCGACCSPPTFAKKVLVSDGNFTRMAVVQQDEQTGDSYDNRGSKVHLCSKYYNRCFDWDASSCTGSAYSPPPSPQCITANSLIGSYPIVSGSSVIQSVWAVSDGYEFTVPLGSGCMVVGGSNRSTALDLTTVPDEALWEIPEQCLKEAKKKF